MTPSSNIITPDVNIIKRRIIRMSNCSKIQRPAKFCRKFEFETKKIWQRRNTLISMQVNGFYVTRTARQWYKDYPSVVQGLPVSGTRTTRQWYKDYPSVVQGLPVSGTRTTRQWYKDYPSVVQGLPVSGTRTTRQWYKD